MARATLEPRASFGELAQMIERLLDFIRYHVKQRRAGPTTPGGLTALKKNLFKARMTELALEIVGDKPKRDMMLFAIIMDSTDGLHVRTSTFAHGLMDRDEMLATILSLCKEGVSRLIEMCIVEGTIQEIEGRVNELLANGWKLWRAHPQEMRHHAVYLTRERAIP